MENIIKRKIIFFISIAMTGAIVDLYSKHLIVSSMIEGEQIKLIGEIFSLHFVYNEGAAFGLHPEKWVQKIVPFISGTVFYTVLSLLASCLVLYLYFKHTVGHWQESAFSLIMAGAIGNISDRIRLGKVVDFISVGINEEWRWPIFNVADSCVSVGIVILLITYKEKTSAPQSTDSSDSVNPPKVSENPDQPV
jgi:signal peptidase II